MMTARQARRWRARRGWTMPSAAMLAVVLALAGCGGDVDRAGSEAGAALAGKLDQATLTARVLTDKARTSGFAVTGVSYGYDSHPQTGEQRPYLEIGLRNESALAIERLWVQVTLAEGGEPWLVQVFNFPISGGLAAGAEGSARLTPEPGSDWDVKAPPEGVPVRAQALPFALRTQDGETLLLDAALRPELADQLPPLR